MGAVGFYIFYGINWIITLLPLPVLYVFSDFIFIILYYFPSYRRKIVKSNLKNAFPEKSEAELKSIGKKYYRHLADLFVETLKLTHMSKKQILRRCKVLNPELFVRLNNEKRDIVAIMGHYNNWEWIPSIAQFANYKYISIYKPLQNKRFGDFMNSLRKQWGSYLVPMSLIMREIINDRKNGVNTCTGFIADQTPVKHEIKYWTTFLNQDTPIYLGPEKIASRYDMAVVFINLQKVRRGYYTMTLELLFEHTAGLPEYAITERHVKRLEEIIKEKPEFWLWSHRRWKHKRPVENA
jgi:Kdo2-lipid IVA lauroyltransferase/acyltransferase